MGIIVSAIFGLRAVAKIFYGPSSEELLEHVKKNPISDLKLYEIVPAGIILLALLFLGFWPRGVSDRIDKEIETRYSSVSKTTSSSLPPCCLLKQNNAKIDGNLTIPSPEKIGVPTQNNFTK